MTISGVNKAATGEIIFDEKNIESLPPHEIVNLGISQVPEGRRIFSRLTVEENLRLGAHANEKGKYFENDIKEVYDLFPVLSDRKTQRGGTLSGGEQQMLAIGRALMSKPKVLLLDEPLSALDAKLREAMQLELVKLQKAVGITFVIVTHDQDEALSMADRIAVIENGMVRQVAPPGEIYESPNCRFVADFIGRMNLFSGIVEGHEDGGVLNVKTELLGKLTIPHFEKLSGELHLAVRPEKLRISSETLPSSHFSFPGEIDAVVYHGSESHVYLRTDAGPLLCATLTNVSRSSVRPKKGERVCIGWAPEDTLVLSE